MKGGLSMRKKDRVIPREGPLAHLWSCINFVITWGVTWGVKQKSREDPRFVIQNWMRRIDTIQYMGLWEQLNNPNLTVSNSIRLEAKRTFLTSPFSFALF